mmetsp:Transcript_43420/g.68002  ORF Transcript_43420/g.68002 Transcript_43420/m.68002 type:complete len:140 (+) Transcript_43420:129-548(+)
MAAFAQRLTMSGHNRIKGPIFALLTPFKDEDLSVDKEALKASLKFAESKGVKSVVSCGTSGEFSSLTISERKEVTAVCATSFKGSTICHISACSVSECLELADHASKIGCKAVLLLPPYYYHDLPVEGIESFLSQVLRG